MHTAPALPPIRRPRAETFAIEDLIDEIRGGRLRIPTFQRAFGWTSRDILSLFDSIYRGYPIGDLLLAQMPAEATDLVFGPVRIPALKREDAWFIVDGQQRINALAGALLHPRSSPCGDRHAIWFDLEHGVFERLTTRDTPPAWVPVNVLIDQARLLHWANQWALRAERPEWVSRAFELSKTLGKYRVPVYILDGADERTLREVFRRANTAGLPLKEAEVFEALNGIGDGRPVDEACARLTEQGFGTVTPKWFVRAVGVVAGDRAGEARGAGPSAEQAITTERALERVFRFMIDDARVPHIDLVPYRRPLLVLSRLFHLFPEVGRRDRERLKRWLWRGFLTGQHMGTSNADIKRECVGFTRSLSEAVDHLIGGVESTLPPFDVRARWSSAGAAASRLHALALWHLGPVAGDGEPLEPSAEAWSQLKRVVASPFNESRPTPLAERLLICGPRGEVLPRPEWLSACRAIAAAGPSVWARHALDAAAADALQRDDSEAFVAARSACLAQHMPDLFGRLGGFGLSDRPAIQTLVARAAAAVQMGPYSSAPVGPADAAL